MADNLLPPNATPLERNVATANAGLGELPVPLRDLKNPDTCPADLLPWLAQELSVDQWDADWSDAQKRETVKASLGVHRRKGTIGAVRGALAALGVQAQLQEWFNQIPAGAPYTYRLLLDLDQVGIDKASLGKMNQVVDATKNTRSHLESIHLTVNTQAGMTIASVAGIGHELTLQYSGPSSLDLLMEGAVNGYAPTEAAVDQLHRLLHSTMPGKNFW